jgi:hypothetical protein
LRTFHFKVVALWPEDTELLVENVELVSDRVEGLFDAGLGGALRRGWGACWLEASVL